MNCVKCGKPIKFIKTQNDRKMPVDEMMVYVVPDDNARLIAVTHTGYTYHARIANAGDKDARKVYLPHWANCKKHTPNHVQAARDEYDRRQDEVFDNKLAFQRRRYEEARRIVRPEQEETAEQISLFHFL